MKNGIDAEIAESKAHDWTPDEERELAMLMDFHVKALARRVRRTPDEDQELAMLMDMYTDDGGRREFNDLNQESGVRARKRHVKTICGQDHRQRNAPWNGHPLICSLNTRP